MSAPDVDRPAPAAYTLPTAREVERTPDGAVDEAPASLTEVPPETTPTFELEMLVSGAVLVGVVQLLGASDGWLRAAMGADRSLALVSTLLVFVAKALLYALSGTFIVHLAARAYWVGLIGLDSVFPGGPRWDRLRYSGPYRRADLSRAIASPRAIAARIDNIASALFSAGFLLALLALPSGLFGVAALALGTLVERATGGRVGLMTVYFVVLAALAGITAVPLWVDRIAGRRITSASPAGRLLARAVHLANLIGLIRISGPIYFTLVTNVKPKIATPLVYLGFFAAFAAAFRDMSGIVNGGRVAHAFVPADLAGGVDPLRYDALRSATADRGRQPSVQSDMIDAPYVRLFVPLGRSLALERAMAVRCPEVRPVEDGADSAAVARQLGCLTAVYATTLDGAPVTAPAHFAASSDESLLGIIRYIPADGLAKGEHILRVAALPDDKGRPQPPRTIPFWR